MNDVAIRIGNVSKLYRRGANERPNTFRESIMNTASAPLRRLRERRLPTDGDENTFWALRDVSFDVQRGEVVGIVGRNGAGKSTLLKILSRITGPTEGRVQINGRVGSLLEVGTGFHPELTGRENIFMNGAILGMSRAEIRNKFDEIVAFSEVEKFIDTPVKRYSSGMYTRLAFAVAAHLEPEILIVDEVLAVGDAAFQKKCLGKMGEVASRGRTVLFVSHNMEAVRNLCTHAVWLEAGQMRDYGLAPQIVVNYLRDHMTERVDQVWDVPITAPGNDVVRLRRASVRPSAYVDRGNLDTDSSEPDALADQRVITTRTPLTFEFEYWNLIPNAYLNLSVVIMNEMGTPLFNTIPFHEPEWHGKPFPVGLFQSTFQIPGDLLNDGTHRVLLYIVRNQSKVLLKVEDVLVFDVQDGHDRSEGWQGKWVGALRPNLPWSTQHLNNSLPQLS